MSEFSKLTDEELMAALKQEQDGVAKLSDAEIMAELNGVGVGETFARGIKQGVTGNFGDELQGAAAATPSITAGAPGAKQLYETLNRKPGVSFEEASKRTIPSFGLDAILGGAQLATDWVAGKVGLRTDGAAERYAKTVEEQRARDKVGADQNPVTSIAGNVAGAIVNPVTRAVPTGGKEGAKVGGVIGGVYGAGDGETLQERATGAAIGGAIGAPLGAVGGALAERAARPVSQATSEVVEAGARQGVTVPNFLATDSKPVQMLSQAGRQSPFGGPKIEQAASDFIESVGSAATRTASRAGSADAMRAGEKVGAAITDSIKTRLPARISKLYDEVDNLMTNPGATSGMTQTRQVADEILSTRRAAEIPGRSSAVDYVMSAATNPAGKSYQEIKNLRTYLGEMVDGARLIPEGWDKAEVKRIYGALTRDLEDAVRAGGGPKALTAWQRANKAAAAAANRKERLAKIVGVGGDASGERVIARLSSMAGSTGNADIRSLQLAKKSLAPDEWDELASGVIARLGRDNADAPFSADKFVTAWNKMTDDAKATMFNQKLRKSLEDIATLANRSKEAEKFRNTSNTGRVGVATAFGAGAMANPLAAISAAVGAEIAARVISRPATARSAAMWSKVYQQAVNKPTAVSAGALQRASRQFGVTIATEMGVPQAANDIGRALMGSVRSAAEDNQNDAKGPLNRQ